MQYHHECEGECGGRFHEKPVELTESTISESNRSIGQGKMKVFNTIGPIGLLKEHGQACQHNSLGHKNSKGTTRLPDGS